MMDMMRKENIGETEHVRCCGDKAIRARLEWSRHVQGVDSKYLGRIKMRLELADRRPAGTPSRTCFETCTFGTKNHNVQNFNSSTFGLCYFAIRTFD